MSTNFQLLKEMKKRVLASGACVDSLIGVPPDSERFNNLLEVALQQQEMACIEMRRPKGGYILNSMLYCRIAE